jgi:hypothetical protein
MLVDFPIFGGYDDRSEIAFDSENLINLFLIGERTGKKKFAYLGTPGLKEALQITESNSAFRALYTYGNSMYGVVGRDVYRFTPPLVKSNIGTVGSPQGFISISANNNGQVIFVDEKGGYIYDVNTSTFTTLDRNVSSQSGFPRTPLNVVSLDGYFIVPGGSDTDSNGRTYQISAINDGTKWDPLDEAQIQAYSGELVGVGIVNRRLYFFKTDSTEVWFNAGLADFPFRRDNNLLFNFGCISASSIISDFGYLFWLARDRNGVGSVMMTTGQAPQKVSNESVDNLIASFSNPSDVTSYLYKDNGHIFLVMSWTTDDTTLVYDITMNNWHQMQMHKTLEDSSVPYSGMVRHLSNCHAYFNDIHYIGSYKGPTIYEFSRDYATNDGEPIRRVRICPHFFDPSYKMLQIKSIQLDMQMGIGLSGTTRNAEFWGDSSGNSLVTNDGDSLIFNEFDAIGIDPNIYLRISRDGGNTFGNYHPSSVGKIGNRRARAIFRNLGLMRDLVAEISFYDPVLPVVILGAAINYEVLNK